MVSGMGFGQNRAKAKDAGAAGLLASASMNRVLPMIPNGFSIRPARLLDARAIARVHVTSWRETYGGLIAETYLDARTPENRTEMWQLALDNMVAGCVFLVVEDGGGEIVGFAYGGPGRDAGTGRSGELYAMYLVQMCHGQGVGQALFELFRKNMAVQGIGDFTAKVLVGNPFRGFFVKMGGQTCGIGESTLPGRRGGRTLTEELFEWV